MPGGEWGRVQGAAVMGVGNTKWDEGPRKELPAFYGGKIDKWIRPDDVAFVEQLRHTATGKLLKTKLREDFRGYKLPAA